MGRIKGWGDKSIGASAKGVGKDVELALEDFDDGPDPDMQALLDEIDEEPAPKERVTKKVKERALEPEEPKRKAKRKANPKPTESVEDLPGGDEPTETEIAADDLGVDLSTECPVCRSLTGCDCTEEDRSFVRRCRFEDDVKKVARCSLCGAPLSVLYVARPGTKPPYDLSHFTAVYGCLPCQGVMIATVAVSAR